MAGMPDVMKEIAEVFADLDELLKNPDVGAELTNRGVNVSLAIVAADALRAYLAGEKERAAEDFETVAEEIAARLAAARPSSDDGSN